MPTFADTHKDIHGHTHGYTHSQTRSDLRPFSWPHKQPKFLYFCICIAPPTLLPWEGDGWGFPDAPFPQLSLWVTLATPLSLQSYRFLSLLRPGALFSWHLAFSLRLWPCPIHAHCWGGWCAQVWAGDGVAHEMSWGSVRCFNALPSSEPRALPGTGCSSLPRAWNVLYSLESS